MSSANSVRVEMTFDGDFRELTAGGMEDEFERSLKHHSTTCYILCTP